MSNKHQESPVLLQFQAIPVSGRVFEHPEKFGSSTLLFAFGEITFFAKQMFHFKLSRIIVKLINSSYRGQLTPPSAAQLSNCLWDGDRMHTLLLPINRLQHAMIVFKILTISHMIAHYAQHAFLTVWSVLSVTYNFQSKLESSEQNTFILRTNASNKLK